MGVPEVISNNKCKLLIITVALFIIVVVLLIAYYYALKPNFWLDPYLLYVFYLLIFMLIVLFLIFVRTAENNGVTEFRDCVYNKAFRLLQAFLITLFLTLVILLTAYTPALIIIEPEKLEEDISLGNQSIKTIAIKNMGADLTNVTYNIKGIKKSWLSLSFENVMVLKNYLKNGEQEFIFASLTIPQNETTGEYRGAIIIQAKANGKDVTKEIPVLLRVKPPALTSSPQNQTKSSS